MHRLRHAGARAPSLICVLLLAACGATPRNAAPTPQQVAAAFAGSPPALAGLHAEADRLLPASTAQVKAALAALRGYPTVVNVWGSWCGPCRSRVPDLPAGGGRARAPGRLRRPRRGRQPGRRPELPGPVPGHLPELRGPGRPHGLRPEGRVLLPDDPVLRPVGQARLHPRRPVSQGQPASRRRAHLRRGVVARSAVGVGATPPARPPGAVRPRRPSGAEHGG